MLPLVPVRCIPSDFINPFPPLYVTTAVCSGLLLLQVLALSWASKSTPAALQPHWQKWARPLLFVSGVAALGAVGLTHWIWQQSRSFIIWCAGFAINLSGQAAAYRAAQDGMLVTETITALLLLACLVALFMRWLRRGPQNQPSPTG